MQFLHVSIGWWIFIVVFAFLLFAYSDSRNPYRDRLRVEKNIDRYDTRTNKLHIFDWMFENILLKFSDHIPEFIINIFLPIEATASKDANFISTDKIASISNRNNQLSQYAMDLHVHTDIFDIFPSRKKCRYVKERAIKNGLDGIACTCHNRVRYPEFGDLFSDQKFLWLTSQEITMQPPYNLQSQKRRGSNKFLNSFHCNAHGTTKMLQQASNMNTVDVINDIHKQGGIANFNHPSKTLIDFMPLFDTVEIWNGKRPRMDVIDYWETLYLSGNYKPGIGGSDFHSHRGRKGFSDIGVPRTIILLKKLEKSLLLDSIKTGKCYLSMGSLIDFCIAKDDEKSIELGEISKVTEGSTVSINTLGIPVENGVLKIRSNDKYIYENKISNQEVFKLSLEIIIEHPSAFRIDVFNDCSEMILITNPIFIQIYD